MKDELSRLYDRDESRFRNHYASDIHSASQTQLAAKLVFSTHSLEKSLSNDNFEIGHGFHVAYLLTEMLNVYSAKGYDKSHLAYINTLSTLKVFYNLHKETEYVEKIETILGDMLPVIEGCTSHMGGASSISRKQKKDNNSKNFKELAEGRYAIRTYSDKPVDKKDIEEVVSIATKTPTVCNRQGVRVYAMYEKDVIEKVLKVQGGIEFYDTPPVLLLITADDSFYVGPNERNQGFIDGGLFAMSMLYSLEYKGLAACPLHAMLDEAGEYAIRGMLDIPESEKLITFMSTGHFNENNSVCKSFRYPVEHILSEKNEIYEYRIEEVLDKSDHNKEVSLLDKARRRLRIRTRIKNTLKKIKHKTRIRTRVRNGIAALRYRKLWRQYTKADGVILTLSGYYNYGNMVQRYALQYFLQKNGYNFVSYTKNMPAASEEDDRLQYTRSFVERNIWQKQYDDRDKFKTYIVGSDQVWRKWGVDDIFDELGYFFLDFTKDREVKRIAYATSIGQDSLESADYTKEFIPHAKGLVSKFDYVSMRELSGVDIVKKEWGVDAQHVIDPTLLLEAEDYIKIIDAAPYDLGSHDSLFTYVILVSDQKDVMIKKIADTMGLSENGIYLEDDKVLPSVEEWLKGIRDSQLVVTDSFHGMVFSIIFNTPFIVLESGTGGAARVTTLLGKLGLLDRYVTSDKIATFDISRVNPIDWNIVNNRLTELRSQSAKWLLDAVRSK